jgi:hypothetical protein
MGIYISASHRPCREVLAEILLVSSRGSLLLAYHLLRHMLDITNYQHCF